MKFSLFEKKEIVMESLEELGFLHHAYSLNLHVCDVLSDQEFFKVIDDILCLLMKFCLQIHLPSRHIYIHV